MRGLYINKWKLFEKLVTAIHLVDESNSRIKWNEKIYGRQFDVTIRTKIGFYDYLTVIECKNFSEPVPVKEVEAFVTKSRSVKADKAVIVSSSGYQSGAEEVAKQNKIELFTLKVSYEIPENLDSGQIVYALNAYDFKLHLPDGKTYILLPEEKNMLPYLIKHTIFKRGEHSRLLNGIMESLREELSSKARCEVQLQYIPLQPGTRAINPIIEKDVEISGFSFAYELVPAKLLKGNVAVDPGKNRF
ncbi:MAG: restriction endonuclease [Nitrospira sp.]|nr:restriction endonuclease [Nitrospira sp.]